MTPLHEGIVVRTRLSMWLVASLALSLAGAFVTATAADGEEETLPRGADTTVPYLVDGVIHAGAATMPLPDSLLDNASLFESSWFDLLGATPRVGCRRHL